MMLIRFSYIYIDLRDATSQNTEPTPADCMHYTTSIHSSFLSERPPDRQYILKVGMKCWNAVLFWSFLVGPRSTVLFEILCRFYWRDAISLDLCNIADSHSCFSCKRSKWGYNTITPRTLYYKTCSITIKRYIPNHIKSQYTMLHQVTPRRAMSHCTMPRHVVPHHATPHHISPLLTTTHLTTPHLTTPYHTSPQHTSRHHTTPHHTSPHHTSPHHTSPHLTTPHHISPHHTSPHLTTRHLTTPNLTTPHLTETNAAPHLTTPHRTTQHHASQHRIKPRRTSPHLATISLTTVSLAILNPKQCHPHPLPTEINICFWQLNCQVCYDCRYTCPHKWV